MEYELLRQYLDQMGFICYPGEFDLETEKHPLVDLAAFKDDCFWAFEYKSFADHLGKGIEQCKCYANWFDRVSLVIERRLTTKSKFYDACTSQGYGILLRGIDGSWAWKRDPHPQNPPESNRGYVLAKFASAPCFIRYLGEIRVGFSRKTASLYRSMLQTEATHVDELASQLSRESRNLYVAITHTGTLLEPKKEKLIVYSKTPLGLEDRVETDEVKTWLNDPRVVYVLHSPGDDKPFDKLERYLRNTNSRVDDILALQDRVSFMVFNIVKYLRHCENGTYTKENEIREVLEEVRGKYASRE
jgi:hypothetical protein